jgi:uncharacterized protein YrrD
VTPTPEQLGPPASYLTLEEGTAVLSSDGEEVGKVDEIRADPDADVFDGLVIESGTLAHERRFVEAAAVDEIYARGVVLKLDAEQARDLPPPEHAAGGS